MTPLEKQEAGAAVGGYLFSLKRKPFYTPPAHCIMSVCEFAKASARGLRFQYFLK